MVRTRTDVQIKCERDCKEFALSGTLSGDLKH